LCHPPDSNHAVIATRLLLWLAAAGWTAEQLMQGPGIRIPGPQCDGGRIPDLTVWSRPQPSAVWLPTTDLLLLAVEIISPGSEAIDRVVKAVEYSSVGVPHYWTVARDPANTVTPHRLAADGGYEVAAQQPLAWLLRTAPADHLPSPN